MQRAAGAVGDLGLAVGIVLLIPLVLIALGAPVVWLARAVIAIAQRF